MTPVLRRLRQEDCHEFEVRMDYMMHTGALLKQQTNKKPKTIKYRGQEMAQWLRPLVALEVNLSSVASTHVVVLVHNSLYLQFWPMRALHTNGTWTKTHQNLKYKQTRQSKTLGKQAKNERSCWANPNP